MTLRNQVLIWIGFFVVIILVLWLFRGILLPFVVGAALAYLLNPLVNQLQRWHFSRGWATAVVLLSVIAIILSLFFMLVPLVGQQIVGLVAAPAGLCRRPAGAGHGAGRRELNEWLGPDRAAQVRGERSTDLVGRARGRGRRRSRASWSRSG